MIKELIYKKFDDERLLKESKEFDKDKKINFAPSYLNDCKRKIFYKKTNTPASNPNDSHSYIKFAMGDSVHEKIQSILKEIGIYQDGEGWNEKEFLGLNWIYRYDGKIINNNTQFIIEIKSAYAAGIESIERYGVKEDHILQLYMYMLFEKIDNGVLFYIGRDNGYMLEYHYTINSLCEKYGDIVEKKIIELVKLKSDIEQNKILDRDFNIVMKNNKNVVVFDFQKDNIKYKSDWQCNYCSWKNKCWDKELEEIKNNSFYIAGEFTK